MQDGAASEASSSGPGIARIFSFSLTKIQKVRSVLKSACSDNFKTVPTFDIWISRSFDN